jgi:hypothetical protein
MVMRLRNRIDRLQTLIRANADPRAGEKQSREIIRAWLDNDPEASPSIKAFEKHCTRMGYGRERRSWVDSTRDDSIAEELGRKVLESYKSYVEVKLGVDCDEISSAFRET